MSSNIKKIILFFHVVGTSLTYSQAPDMEWHKGYGTDNGEHIHEIMQTRDGGYIGIGQTSEGRGADILVVKIDFAGEFKWQRIIGTAYKYDIGICVDEAGDGYLIGGGLFDGNQKRYMAKLDDDGNIIWQHTYKNDRNGMIRGIDILSNGEIVVTGYKNCSQAGFVFIADDSDGFIMKTDSKGNVIWEKPISAPQGAKVRKEMNKDGFVICTTIWMNHPEYAEDFYLIKTDQEGNEYWNQNYGGDSDEHCYDFDLTTDGGYILGGHTRSPSYGVVNWDFLMIKIDSEGNEEWHRTFGQPRGYDPNYIHDEAYGIRQTPDGGYVIVGGTGDEYEYSESGSLFGASDIWKVYLVKVNSNGELQWESVYGSNTENNAGEYLGLTSDGGFIIGSDSDSAGKEDYRPNNFGFMKIKGDKHHKNPNMVTRWAMEMDADNILPEYPRPNMKRNEWQNLNGIWDYAIVPRVQKKIENYQGKILVPFPVESALSGVQKQVVAAERLWYRRTFIIPEEWENKKILLHFGAVDWETTVWINGAKLGEHRGGYDAFSFDITDALNKEGEQEIVIAVWDPTEEGHQPRGKQTKETFGIWYTAVTGIWQTVWMEPVEKERGYIESLKLTPDIDRSLISITTNLSVSSEKMRVKASTREGEKEVGAFTAYAGDTIVLSVRDARLWSPQNPFLYDLEVSLLYEGEVIDHVKSYFGMRKISKKKDERGVWRLALNNEIYFQFGMLDQGWWPDGLYRAPTDDALKYDIEVAKTLGFNMLRKHGKMEPQRWYYWCDKLGILVWQDMTPGDIQGEYGTDRSPESAAQFELEYSEMLDELYNFPGIVTWVIFNEGWGQYDTERLVEQTKRIDPHRMVIGASGFVDKGVGDIHDVHSYPGPTGAALEKDRVTTLGEFGGLGFPVNGHLWDDGKAWGYESYKSVAELSDAYQELIEKLYPYVSEGISAAVYTQITDVENEVNGMMTYDRAVTKMDRERIHSISQHLYSVKPGSYRVEPVIPTSQKTAQEWRYLFNKPADGWEKPGFDDRNWKTGKGGFGDPKDNNPVIRTEWRNRELWLRKKFSYEGSIDNALYLQLFHQFELLSLIYLNGKLIAEGPEHSNAYTFIELDEKAKSVLNQGQNILAVYCKNNGRRAYFDAGLVIITKQ